MKTFQESDFVVTFLSEYSNSRVIRTWDRVLAYLDYELNQDIDWTVRDEDCELHQIDEWHHLNYSECGDTRHFFWKTQFAYCVGLSIIRLTEDIPDIRILT